jgi:hypothetical protein
MKIQADNFERKSALENRISNAKISYNKSNG